MYTIKKNQYGYLLNEWMNKYIIVVVIIIIINTTTKL